MLAERLKEARKAKGWTQYRLAIRTGIGQSLIAAYEKDKRVPGAFNLLCLADALDVSTDWLLGRTDKKELNK